MSHNLVMDILPLTLLAILLYKAKLQKPLNALNDSYLSVDTGKCYRGFFAIAIAFHHLAQRSVNGIAFHYFVGLGGCFNAIFFFLSAYGLQKSYITKQEKYKRFFLRRIPSVLIPYIFITILYWLVYYLTGRIYTIKNLVDMAVREFPLISISWFIVAVCKLQ